MMTAPVPAGGNRAHRTPRLPPGSLADLQSAVSFDPKLLGAIASVPPPFYLRRWFRMLGQPAAFVLLERVGGLRIAVPSRLCPASALARDCGPDVAARMVAHFRGNIVKVPLLRSWRAAVWLSAGYSIRAVATHLRCTESAVSRAAAEFDLASGACVSTHHRNTTT
jgi:hypothetical protein